MKWAIGAQMNTNCDMLPVSALLVHIHPRLKYSKTAQKFGKTPPL